MVRLLAVVAGASLLSGISLAAPAPLQHTFAAVPSVQLPRLEDASIATLLEGLASSAFSSQQLTQAYLDRDRKSVV